MSETPTSDETADGGDEHSPSEEAKERREYTVKIARRVGYVLFLGGGLVLFVTLVVGVVEGISNDRVWDPYTGEPHYGAECLQDARRLIEDATEYDRVAPPWKNRYHRWVSRCRKRHPTVFQMLKQSREAIPSDEGESETHSSDAGSTSPK